MSVYVDSSALLKRYLEEPDSSRYDEALLADPDWICARHTAIEVRRNFPRVLESSDLADARVQFQADWAATRIVEIDEALCDLACDLAEATGARTLDAIHLAAAQRVGGGSLPFLTADLRQAQIARSLGWIVLGA
jgi:predicted nucleic acid-binding protein